MGESQTAGGDTHAFIAGPNGVGMLDLNSLVYLPDRLVLNRAIAINDQGQVLAYAGFPPPPIPEPASYALMLAGLGLVGFMAQCKKPADNIVARG